MIGLTAFQYKTLDNAANGTSKVFVVLKPSSKDSEDKQKNHLKDVTEIEQLVGLGLAEDVSGSFNESIQMSKLNDDRDFKVFTITELGTKMFLDCDKRLVN